MWSAVRHGGWRLTRFTILEMGFYHTTSSEDESAATPCCFICKVEAANLSQEKQSSDSSTAQQLPNTCRWAAVSEITAGCDTCSMGNKDRLRRRSASAVLCANVVSFAATPSRGMRSRLCSHALLVEDIWRCGS